MRIALFIFTLSLTTATLAVASPLDRVNRETALCMRKIYSAEELAARPPQTVRSIAMQLFEQPDQKDHTVYLNLQIELTDGVHDAFMLCDRTNPGLRCAVECDGGGADVVKIGKDEHRLQFVNRGFMVSGGCGGAEEEGDIWLAANPGGDDAFELETATVCP